MLVKAKHDIIIVILFKMI